MSDAVAEPMNQPDPPAAPPATPEPGRKPTPQEIELHWLRTVYRGDRQPQLTFRAVLTGALLGSFMALSNLYAGLKVGWSFGVAITACILSFSIFRAGRRVGIFRTEPSILENNCMQSTASAAGSSTGTTLVSAFAALVLITGHNLPMWQTLALVFFLAMLGVFMAIPMKRTMINVEQLPFPSGTAAAGTLESLHAEGIESVQKSRSLLYAMAAAGVLKWFTDGMQDLTQKLSDAKSRFAHLSSLFTLPSYVEPSMNTGGALRRRFASAFNSGGYGFCLEMSTLLVAAGAIMGFRTTWSMMLGALVNYAALVPWMHRLGVIEKLGYSSIVKWSVWPGVAMMVTAALLNFGMQGKTLARAFGGLGGLLRGKKRRAPDADADALARIEVPHSWFAIGFLLAAAGCVYVNWIAFHIAFWLGALAVLISFVLAIVACRATGETDTTPIGALGKITQLTYAGLVPQTGATGFMTANLMTANITSSVAASSADLLTDLKSGYLLGANPRKQFLAQFFGVFAGAAVAVPAFYLMVPNAQSIGNDKFPAPSALVWKAVAELLAKGLHSMHPTAIWGMALGGLVGIALTLLEKRYPRHKRFIPSPTGLGLAFVIPAWNSVSMFLGGLIALAYERRNAKNAEKYIIPVASGLIAGESILGVLVTVLKAVNIL